MIEKVVVIGGTGFVGRALAAQLGATSGAAPVFVVHREKPEWLDGSEVQAIRCDLGDVAGMAALLDGAAAIINLLRPDGSGERLQAIAGLIPVFQRARPQVFLHTSSIDVYGGNADPVIDEATPPVPVSPYAREHLEIEARIRGELPQSAVIRLGAVFGTGGKNVVAFAKEAAGASLLRLAARRMLYADRRIHLVSVAAVVACLVQGIRKTDDGSPRLMLLTDDADARNNFGFVQDTLLRAFRRPTLHSLPQLPRHAATGLLRLVRRPYLTVERRYAPRFEPLPGASRPDFGACLVSYAQELAAGSDA